MKKIGNVPATRQGFIQGKNLGLILPSLSLIVLLMQCVVFVNAQSVYTNRNWVDYSAYPDSVYKVFSLFDYSGNLVIVGNTVNASGNSDIFITKYDDMGNILWQDTYSGTASMNDYGITAVSDIYNNIYVAGVEGVSFSNQDIVVLKWDMNGNLVSAFQWDGVNHLADIPTSILLDVSGNLYVGGGTQTQSQFTDYVVIKLSSSGVEEWVYFYDYTGLYDFVTGMQLDNLGDIIVTGASATSLNAYDYATLKLDKMSGQQLDINRVTIPGVGLDQPSDIIKDSNGNIYVTGFKEVNGNKDIQTIKINPVTFTVLWVKDLDCNGLDDYASDMEADNMRNIYLTGYTDKANGGTDLITVKYDSLGNLLWKQHYQAVDDSRKVKGYSMVLKNDGKVIVTGEIENVSGYDIITICYDSDGELLWANTYNGTGNGSDTGGAIETDASGNIYITGLSTDSISQTRYVTIQYNESMLNDGFVYNQDSVPSYFENELIVKFHAQYVNTAFVDAKDKQYCRIMEVLADSVIDSLNTRVSFDFRQCKLYKVYRKMTSNDSISVTRLGDTLKMPKFWSSFLVSIPATNTSVGGGGLGTRTLDLMDEAQSLMSLPLFVDFAQPNHLYFQDGANDPFYISNQSSLHPIGNFSSANINLEAAWDIESGSQNVKVGIYDDAVFWGHEDFGDGTFTGSKIAGGWDFSNNVHISAVTQFGGNHGTGCAGIIGALRNNKDINNNYIGIAGIAGGDMDTGNPGCQLFSMGIAKRTYGGSNPVNGPDDFLSYIGDNLAAEAIVEGAAHNPVTGFGYGLHIQNHSWGGENYSPILEAAVKNCFRNQCVFVASRGNDGLEGSPVHYPACYHDNWVMNVGASGNDGEYKVGANGTNIPNGEDDYWGTSVGLGIDLIAPGSKDNVVTTHNPNAGVTFDYSSVGCSLTPQDIYNCYNGTSSAAPHVSGVAALLQSRHTIANGSGYSNNLAPEDVEYVLQKYAKDWVVITPLHPQCNNVIGYDDCSGWGLLDAGEALIHITLPEYEIYHRQTPNSVGQPVWLNLNNATLVLNQGYNGIAAGSYPNSSLVKVTHYYTDILPANTQLEDVWLRPGSTVGMSGANPNTGDDTYSQISSLTINGNILTLEIETFAWRLWFGASNIQWIPDNPANLKTAYSLHLKHNLLTEIETEKDNRLSLFPNPTSDILHLSGYFGEERESLTMEITDFTGRKVKTVTLPNQKVLDFSVNISELASGVYCCKISSEKEWIVKKFIKF
ncbi:MAG: S8 family serine peptidase [Bacteroidia bacterium]|nr:S8 family serine peptidase [Bacteroidia bacterium]